MNLYKDRISKKQKKRTTYILIGLLVLGLLLVPFIFTKQKEPKTVLPIDGERAEIEMAGIRHI